MSDFFDNMKDFLFLIVPGCIVIGIIIFFLIIFFIYGFEDREKECYSYYKETGYITDYCKKYEDKFNEVNKNVS